MYRASGLTAAASILVYVGAAPIVEELVFRGIVLEGLVNAGIHAVGGIGQVTIAFLTGLVFGWLYVRTRSIVPSSVAHIIYNAVAFYPLIVFALRTKHF